MKVYSLPQELNRLTLLDGRMPEAEDECVVDRLMLTKMDVAVGDTLRLRTQGTYADALARTEEAVQAALMEVKQSRTAFRAASAAKLQEQRDKLEGEKKPAEQPEA